MRIFSAVLFLLFTQTCLAVGWKEISREMLTEFNIEIKVEHNDWGECHNIVAKLPQVLMLNELGNRKLGIVRYYKITQKKKGWQLNPRGT